MHKAPEVIRSKVKPSIRNFSRSYAIDFEDADSARQALSIFSALDLDWVDTKTGENKTIRVRPDRSLHARHQLRVAGSLWKQVELHLKKNKLWEQTSKLGTARGRLYYIVNDEPAVLFRIESNPDVFGAEDFSISPELGNIKDMGISEDLANAWIDLALASITKQSA